MRIEELWRKTVSGEKGLAYSFFRFFLSILTIPYLIGFFLFRKIQSHRAVKLPCPVIGIGNITLGGTGKTSLAILLGRKLEEMGLKIAILCTGYGGKGEERLRGKRWRKWETKLFCFQNAYEKEMYGQEGID
ncbi:MAG: tetraacyldisaccharide 4'-kinase [bacterium]